MKNMKLSRGGGKLSSVKAAFAKRIGTCALAGATMLAIGAAGAETNVRKNPVTGAEQTFTFAFTGGTDNKYETLANWNEFENSEWSKAFSQTIAPHLTGSATAGWSPTLIDGNLIADSTRKSVELTSASAKNFEGWNTQIALMNGVTLTVNKNLVKQQSGQSGVARFMWVDDTSKLIFNTVTESGNCDNSTALYVAAEEGIVFNQFSPKTGATFNYYLKGAGSVKYAVALGRWGHAIKQCEMVIDSTTKTVTKKPLVTFPSASVTFTTSGATVTSSDTAVSPIPKTTTPTTDDPVGTYQIAQETDGVYLYYVNYKIDPTDVDLSGDIISTPATWSDKTGLALDGDWGHNKLNLTLTNKVDEATLTFDTNFAAAKFALASEAGKNLTIAKGESAAVAVGNYDFSDVNGEATITFATGSSSITIGENAKVTLSGDAAPLSSDAATVSGAGMIVINAASKDTDVWGGYSVTGTNQYVKGTWNMTGTNYQNTVGEMLFTSENAILKINNQDATGYGTYTTGLTLEDGAELQVYKRDTFSRKLTLRNGAKVLMNADNIDSGRAFDLFSNSSLYVEGTEPCIIGGINSTAEAPTTASGIVAIRRSDFTITTAADATLKVYSQIATAASGAGNLIAAGAGTVEFYRAASSALPLVINGGKVVYVNGGSASKAGVTVAEGATFEVSAADAVTYTNTEFSVSGAGAFVKSGAGAAKFTGNFTVPSITLDEGALDLRGAAFGAATPAVAFGGTTGTITLTSAQVAALADTVTIPKNALVQVQLTSDQVADGFTAEKLSATGASIEFLDNAGASLGAASSSNVYVPQINTWTAAATPYEWSNTACWSKGAVPAATDWVKIEISADTTLTISEEATVANVVVEKTDTDAATLTVTGSAALTVTDSVTAKADVSAYGAAFKVGNGVEGTSKGHLIVEEGVTVALAVASGTYTLPGISGAGTVEKAGAGTLLVYGTNTTAPDGARVNGTTIDVQAGTFALKGGQLKNATLKFADGTSFKSNGWVDMIEQLTVDVATSATVRFSELSGTDPALTNTGTLIKKGEGTFRMTLRGGTKSYPVTIEAGVLAVEGYGVDANTMSGVISGAGSLTVVEGTVALTAANTYTGATTIASGATLSVAGIAKVGGSSEVEVAAGGTLKFTSSVDTNEDSVDLSKITGTGTVVYEGNGWRTLPNTAAKRFASTLALCNKQATGLILTQGGNARTVVGTLSGTGGFRADWGQTGQRALRVIQSANSEHTGNLIQTNDTRFDGIEVAGATDATDKTLTLSGTTTYAKLLNVLAAGEGYSAGSVKITGTWPGAVTIGGALEIAGDGSVTGAITIDETGTLTVAKDKELAATSVGGAGTINVTADETPAPGAKLVGGTFSGFTGAVQVNGEEVAYEVKADGIYTMAGVAKIGDKYYETLAAAVADAADGDTVELLADATGDGINIAANKFATDGITIDFGGFTYTVGSAVGSSQTVTQGFRFLAGNTVELKNGTIALAEGQDKVKVVINNYAALTLTGMTIDGTNLAPASYGTTSDIPQWTTPTIQCVVGTVTMTGTTVIAPAAKTVEGEPSLDNRPIENPLALMVANSSGASYTAGAKITVGADCTVTGKIGIYRGVTPEASFTTESYNFVVDKDAAIDAPEGYKWVVDETAGTKTLAKDEGGGIIDDLPGVIDAEDLPEDPTALNAAWAAYKEAQGITTPIAEADQETIFNNFLLGNDKDGDATLYIDIAMNGATPVVTAKNEAGEVIVSNTEEAGEGEVQSPGVLKFACVDDVKTISEATPGALDTAKHFFKAFITLK